MADTLIIACGALAREIIALIRQHDWQHLRVQCLPARLHNTPAEIPGAVAAKLQEAQGRYAQVFVAYADCGTGGALDRVLAEYGAERLPGAHCYAFFAGEQTFDALAEAEPGTFYLTDFLTRHFDRLVMQGLGLDRHPELLPMYFGHYRKLVYLRQTHDEKLPVLAQEAAARLGLSYHEHFTGYGELTPALRQLGQQTTQANESWPS